MKKPILYFLSSIILLSQTACFGSFRITNIVYDWNDGVSDDKFVKSALMWAMFIIPIYELAAIGDFLIFNLIEFWSGSNPISMNDGEIETEKHFVRNKEYLVTASKNQFKIEQITDGKNELVSLLKYDEENKSWYSETENDRTKILSINSDETVTYYTKSGQLNMASSTILSGMEDLAQK